MSQIRILLLTHLKTHLPWMGHMCNDCVPACVVGFEGHSMEGKVLYCRSTVTGCSDCQGDLVMCFPPSTVAPGWVTSESSVLSWAFMRADVY